MTALHLIAAYLLGAISFGVFVLVVLVRVHRRPATSPTFKHRRFRDPPIEVVPKWQAETVEPGVRYEHLGMTGEEA